MISQSQTNQSPTGSHDQPFSLVKETLRQWLNNPLTFVFLVWGVLFIGLGLLLLLLP